MIRMASILTRRRSFRTAQVVICQRQDWLSGPTVLLFTGFFAALDFRQSLAHQRHHLGDDRVNNTVMAGIGNALAAQLDIRS